MQSLSVCPQCRERYSTRLPTTQYYSRCGLPMTLSCGHGVCYHCVVSKRTLNKNSQKTGAESLTICCKVCQVVSTIQREAVRNILGIVNCYQMGLIHLEDLELEIAGENISFKEGIDEFFVPKSPENSIRRVPFTHPGECAKHKVPLDYWCNEDEIPLCAGCRITSHLTHDVIKITEKNAEELNKFYTVVNETVTMIDEMRETYKSIQKKYASIRSDYNTLSKQMRSHFSELHAMLAVREQQAQQHLFQSFQDCTGPMKDIEKHMREAYFDINCELQKANTLVNSPDTTRRCIIRNTETLCRFNFYEQAVHQTLVQLDSTSLSVNVEPIREFETTIKSNPVVSVHYSGSNNCWTRLQSQFDDLKQLKNRSIIDAMNATSPADDPTEKKKARKQLYNQLDDIIPIVISQAANHDSELSGLVVHLDSDRFYIQIQGPSSSEFGILQEKIHLHDSKPVPRLSELHLGQLVAGRYCGQWYRALIESINIKCDDVVIFFIDYGNRELTTVKEIRLLDGNLTFLPAQAVRCALTKSPSSLNSLSYNPAKHIRVKVDRTESGGVGRLDEPELTLWVTLICESNWMRVPDMESLLAIPSVPLAWPSTIHKVLKVPTPPPAGVDLKRKKKFPANKSPDPVPPYILPKDVHQGQENRFRTKVTLIHQQSPGQFYVRVDSAEKTYQNLTQQLEIHFSRGMGIRLDSLEANLVCAVWLDKWNRCRIIQLEKKDVVVVELIDAGRTEIVNTSQLFRLDEPHLLSPPAMALQCRLWGISPAGHISKWSGSSNDKMKELVKLANSIFIQVYYIRQEDCQKIHYVRLYFEYLQPGGPLELDQTLTCCLNDELFIGGLALRQSMPVTVQPFPKRWLPSLSLPPELDAIPSWIDDEANIYIQRPRGPTNHLELISQLLNWHYATSTPTQSELDHWDKDEPCVARYSKDKKWCRAIVLDANDETKMASLFYIDYGNQDKEVAYADMRKCLICYEYAAEASRCRMSKYPGPCIKPTEPELTMLDTVLVNQLCQVRVNSGLIELKLLSNDSYNLDEILEQIRPLQMDESPPPTIPMSSVDMDDSIFDEFSDDDDEDVDPIFHFDGSSSEMYRSLRIPDRRFLPIRIVALLDDENRAVIQPARYSLNDGPTEWQEQVDNFARLESELQRSAPLFPDVEVVDHGSPCGCRNPADERWYRGIMKGYADDSLHNIRVELVDIGSVVDLPRCYIKQLPTEYLHLPRHSIVSRLIDYPLDHRPSLDLSLIRHCMQMETPLRAYFKETGHPLEMTLFYKDCVAKFIPALELY